MELNTIAEIARTTVSVALLLLTIMVSAFKAGAAKSLVHHLSYTLWERRLRKAGFSEKKIRKILAKAALTDLTQ